MRITCPHCNRRIQMGHSAFVTNRHLVKGANADVAPSDYHPDPAKTYKTTEEERRHQLGYYWRNRPAILKRMKARRDRDRAILKQAS